MLEGGDFSNLSSVLVVQGKTEQAQAVAADQRKMMRGHPEVEFVGKLIEYQQAQKEGDRGRMQEALGRLLRILETSGAGIAPSLQVDVLEACFELDEPDKGYVVARGIAHVKGVERSVLARVRKIVDAHRKAPKAPKPLGVPGIMAALDTLSAKGWDADLAAHAYDAIMRGLRDVKPETEEQAQLTVLLERYETLKTNFGIVRDVLA